jgi:hypothetical protein
LSAHALPPQGGPPLRLFLLSSLALIIGLCSAGCGSRRFSGKRLRVWRVAALCQLTVLLMACGGGFNGPPTTQPGSYVITIVGTSGTLQASTSVTVVVR